MFSGLESTVYEKNMHDNSLFLSYYVYFYVYPTCISSLCSDIYRIMLVSVSVYSIIGKKTQNTN